MDGLEATPIAGTADAVSPFFSPDSQWLAFFAEGKLKKVAIGAGSPVIICDAAIGFGGSWGSNGIIVFAPTTGSPLLKVDANGGSPERVTTLDTARGEFSHRWPHLLPGGRAVVFTVGTLGSWDDAEIVVQSLETDRRETLVKGGTHPQYRAGRSPALCTGRRDDGRRFRCRSPRGERIPLRGARQRARVVRRRGAGQHLADRARSCTSRPNCREHRAA